MDRERMRRMCPRPELDGDRSDDNDNDDGDDDARDAIWLLRLRLDDLSFNSVTLIGSSISSTGTSFCSPLKVTNR